MKLWDRAVSPKETATVNQYLAQRTKAGRWGKKYDSGPD